MKKLLFTKHAKNVIVKRKLDEPLIFNAVSAPDEVFLDRPSNLMVAIKRDGLALIVVYDVLNDRLEVVTAFKTSKLAKLIRSKVDKGRWVKVR